MSEKEDEEQRIISSAHRGEGDIRQKLVRKVTYGVDFEG